jgi:hypothetical protein
VSEFKPKHTVFDKEKFSEERAKLGGISSRGYANFWWKNILI